MPSLGNPRLSDPKKTNLEAKRNHARALTVGQVMHGLLVACSVRQGRQVQRSRQQPVNHDIYNGQTSGVSLTASHLAQALSRVEVNRSSIRLAQSSITSQGNGRWMPAERRAGGKAGKNEALRFERRLEQSQGGPKYEDRSKESTRSSTKVYVKVMTG